VAVERPVSIDRVICFGAFKLDVRAGELRRRGFKVKLQEQPFQVLRLLLERPGEVVTPDEIIRTLWPNGTIVEYEHSIKTAVKKVRQALGDDGDSPRYVETLPRRGYRFIYPVGAPGIGPNLPLQNEPQKLFHQALAGGVPVSTAAPSPARAGELPSAAQTGTAADAANPIAPVEWVESKQARSPVPAPSIEGGLIGQKVSHYRVLEVIGGGGMGVVYKAEDLKLGRRVALKFLPEELAGDPVALERFEREAKAASALEHPNICPVYEFGEHNGQPFIAMQLLSGQTLRDRLAGLAQARNSDGGRERLPVTELLDLANQIANGLDAAHSQGIIHRDIKPANIFVTVRGDIKILDFGLAKLVGPADEIPQSVPERDGPESESQQGRPNPKTALSNLRLTRTGKAIGTASYMSPEQVRGEKLDGRTDLFSFGLVAYEMATGQVAFAGNTAVEVHNAILNQTPTRARNLNPDIPPKLEEIITKALEKNRDARYETASQMRFELERLRNQASLRRTASRRKSTRLTALASAVVVITIGATIWLSTGRRGAQSAGALRIAPFTGLPGLEDEPAISPNGKEIAYVWDGGSRTSPAQAAPHPPGHIYVKLIGAGAPLRLTQDSFFDQDPAWSPDGRYIAFIRNANPADPSSKSQVITIPALGGRERRLAENDWPLQPAGRGLTWSPDGKSIVINTASGRGLFLVYTENGEKRRLTSPPKGAWDTDPAFSPDGRTMAFVRGTGIYRAEIYSQNVNSGEAKRLTFDKATIWGLAWTPDGRDIVFSSKRSGFPTLWKIPASGGKSEPVAAVGGNAYSPAVSLRGNVLAYVNQETNMNIWGVRIDSSGRAEGAPSKIISGTGAQFDDEISPDGRRVVFGSDRSGDDEIWVANIDGSNLLQLTSLHAPLAGSPHWSPDGHWIVFGAWVDESGGAFVVGADGGTPRRLTPPGVMAFTFAWSHDGKSIYFDGNPSGKWGIWKMPAQGGEAVRVVDGFECRESGDGKWLYFSRPINSAEDKTAILRIPVGGGPETPVFNGVTDRFWTLAGQNLYFLDVDSNLHATIKRLDLTTRKITRIAHVQKEPFVMHGWIGLSVSPESGWIMYPQVDDQVSRIMLVENFSW
jgi:serine/threonine protein kinase/DNA-binding winged helix-turn-helix (wHTH) protein/WD40 repeat protein